MTTKKFHLKGLDTLRAIASIFVLIGHVEIFKSKYNLPNYRELDVFNKTGGHIGVVLFFAISGFLITLLLEKEKEKTGKIKLKNFYLRRIFRVWPLYYLILILSYFILDFQPNFITLILCLTVFPNIAQGLGLGWTGSPQVWSIGVEEQFYIFWPFIVKFSKNLLMVTISLFIIFSILPFFFLFIIRFYELNTEWVSIVNNIAYGTKYGCMAIGGFFAILYMKKRRFLEKFYKFRLFNYFLIILPFILWFNGTHFIIFTDEFYAILFSISILLLSTNSNLIDIDNSLTKFLGKISYGIYMYHWIVLHIVFHYGIYFYLDQELFTLKLYFLIIIPTIIIAYLSFRFFEKPFLTIKEKYKRD
jgi:peptidoglycan/LPS O-acetylase OafA/YrhL